MSTTLQLLSQYGDLSSYSTTDALGTPVTEPINTQNAYAMQYASSSNTANTTTTTPTKYYAGQHSITVASNTYDIDLTLLTDIFGNVLNFSRINLILIHNNTVAGGSDLLIGGAGSNPWTGPWNGSSTAKNLVPPGGDWRQSAPYTGFLVNGGSKVLRITNDDASPTGPASFNIQIWGS